MPIALRNSVRKLRSSAPYLVAAICLCIAIFVNSVDSEWMSGITGNYLSVHIVLEFIGILVSIAVFVVGWSTYHNAQDTDILVLCVASFAVGLLDLGHTLSFTGMPDFFGPSGPNKAIDFWLASRLTGSLAFLYVALSRPRMNRIVSLQWILLTIAAAWVTLTFYLALFQPEELPVFFIKGQGLTPIKIIFEWLLVVISCGAGILLFVGAEKKENMNVRWMACASLLYGMCGYFFTIYKDFDDLYNFTGHCFKAISYVVLYRAVFVECVSKPYERVQQLAAQAEASNLSKSRFLANVSHEFRTPLGVIGGFGDLMLNSGKLDESLKGWAQTIVRNAKQLSLLIDDLLDLAKAETEKIEIHLARLDLGILLSQLAQSLEMQSKSQVKIRVDNKLESNNVVTDELRLRQILINIIGNAIKFTQKGEVKILVQRIEKKYVEILVEDSGIGIDPSETGRLFQPFSQVSNPNNRNFGGTGLGLSLSRKLTELLGGSLELKWSKPNVGSCFSIIFEDRPSKDISPVSTAKLEEKTGVPQFAGQRILIAEDSADNRMLLNSYLAPTNIEITFAENGRQALNFAKALNVKLILMDIQMPEMDGFEATAELRKHGWDGQIVALTAHALQPERDRAMKNGFNDYLVKPIQKEALWKAISTNLRA